MSKTVRVFLREHILSFRSVELTRRKTVSRATSTFEDPSLLSCVSSSFGLSSQLTQFMARVAPTW